MQLLSRRRRGSAEAGVQPDVDGARALRSFERRLWMLLIIGIVLVAGFVIAATLVDPRDLAPAVDSEHAPSWVGFATSALTVGVVALLVAMLGMVRARRQRRTLARSPLQRTSARWAPTRKRGQEIPGLAFEQTDGTWAAATLPLPTHVKAFASGVRLTGAVDVAADGSYLVVRAPGSNTLLSAKATGTVDVAALPSPAGPLVAMRAGELVGPGPVEPDTGPWFREVLRSPAAALHGLFLLGIAGVWLAQLVNRGGQQHGGEAFSILTRIVVVGCGLFILSTARTVTRVDHEGVFHRRTGSRPKRVPFARIKTVERFATEQPRRPTRVDVTLADDSVVTIPTRRPDQLLDALRRGRVFADVGPESTPH